MKYDLEEIGSERRGGYTWYGNWGDFLDKFIAEARAAASVVHPHIVTVHNIGQTGEHHYIELEYVAGRSLQNMLIENGRLPALQSTQWMLQSCSALAAAHRSGLIHRDFKPRDIQSLVAEAAAALNLTVRSEGNCQVVTVPLPGGRHQQVYIEDRTEGPWSQHLVKIYSLCCPVREDYFRRALELNASITFGALAIEQVDGQPCFVMVNRYPRSTCDTEEIRQSVVDISKWADQVEFALTGKDRY